jgi:hypothetical protein
MKRKIIIAVVCAFIVWIISWFVNSVLFWSLFVLGLIFVPAILIFFRCNKWLKKTNWYRNHFIYTSQFVSNAGYRENTQRNYEIVNLGSNPARFAFFYEKVWGQNWSTGSQGLDMDLEILKYFHSYIQKDGIVLIPIVAFSSVSGYLKPDLSYVVKFASILDGHQVQTIKMGIQASKWIRYPLFYNWKFIRYLIKDAEKDNRLTISEQMMQPLELNMDALGWIKYWKDEFNIKDLEAPLEDALMEGRKKSVMDLQKIIDFCLERSLKPVLIFPPMSDYLSRLFSDSVRETYIYSFIREVNNKNIPFLDYMDDMRFSDPNLYFNSFFLNLKGRKLFTEQVLNDLKKIMLKEKTNSEKTLIGGGAHG